MSHLKVLISGGGTGGHIFPAIAIANQIKELHPDAEFLFVGAQGKMEMEKVPAAGYPIRGLWISGFNRSMSLSNLMFPFKLISSLWNARKIVKQFKPDVAVGTGGFASGPTLRVASQNGVPSLLQEQNSFPGVTNRILAAKAKMVCVAYEGMEKYFGKEKIMLTGNPVRKDMVQTAGKRAEGLSFFGLSDAKKTVLIVGGSLGAQSVNKAVLAQIEDYMKLGVQLLWQTGKTTYKEINSATAAYQDKGVVVKEFIFKMDLAYAVADVVISRAGAIAVSELSIVAKPTVLVPFPHAAEDHQTKNAQSLVDHKAALMVADKEVDSQLFSTVKSLVNNPSQMEELRMNMQPLGKPEATLQIAREVLKLVNK